MLRYRETFAGNYRLQVIPDEEDTSHLKGGPYPSAEAPAPFDTNEQCAAAGDDLFDHYDDLEWRAVQKDASRGPDGSPWWWIARDTKRDRVVLVSTDYFSKENAEADAKKVSDYLGMIKSRKQ